MIKKEISLKEKCSSCKMKAYDGTKKPRLKTMKILYIFFVFCFIGVAYAFEPESEKEYNDFYKNNPNFPIYSEYVKMNQLAEAFASGKNLYCGAKRRKINRNSHRLYLKSEWIEARSLDDAQNYYILLTDCSLK